jgi:pimeloyl-ACP methyl ester carboxylesterase
MPRQRADVAAALSWLAEQSDVDSARLALWGTSLGGMNVVRVAATRPDLAAAVVQCPIVHGPGAARSLGISGPLRLTPAIVEDVVRSVTRRGRRYVPIVGPPGSLAMVAAPGAEAGWNSTVPPGHRFDNRIAAADAVAMVTTSALRHARRVTAPLLVCVCDEENLMNPRYAALVAERAPKGEARHYASDHFAIYHPPLVSRVLADQTAFLVEHLDVHA